MSRRQKRISEQKTAKILKFPVHHKPLSLKGSNDLSFEKKQLQLLKNSRTLERQSDELVRFAEETLKKVVGK